MGFLVGLLLCAFIILVAKHVVLYSNHHMLKVKQETLESEYDTVYKIAVQLQTEAKGLVARNKTLSDIANNGGTMDTKLVKELIVFCHPDKHHGSEKASRLTQQLIKVRDGK